MEQTMSALDALFTRRSIRTFTDEPVSDQDIETIVRAGMYAPSAHNGRTWQILTTTNREKLLALSTLHVHWKPLSTATLGIACCCTGGPELHFLEQNGAAATENMLLAAHALGLGGVWLNSSPKREHYGPSKAILGIPEEAMFVAMLAIGYPAPDQPARAKPERFEPEKWHKEVW